jgi:inosose dehydratase
MNDWQLSRRRFVQAVGVAAAAGGLGRVDARGADAAPTSATASGPDRFHGLKLGVATYTFKQRPLGPTIEGVKRVDLHYCSIKDFHLPLKSSAEQRKDVADQFRAAGIVPLSCGNISMRKEEDVRQAFEYARDAGIPTIVCAPTHEMIPVLDKLVKEFDTIRIAIHNHGPEDKSFPAPTDVWNLVKDLDPRLGLCVDVGHSSRAGENPAEAIRKYKGRVYDCHLKDLATANDPKSKPIEVGRGCLDIPDILRALVETKMPGHVGFEYEIRMDDPLPGLAESVGYTRGVLAMMPA